MRIYDAALGREVGERAAFLDEICTGNESLRRELESLLAHESDATRSGALAEAAARETGGRDDAVELQVGQQLGHYRVVARLDHSGLAERYPNPETGPWAYDPKVLLKVVLFGYSRGLVSSRKLEAACRENVTFMALACGQQPDHSTIAAFVSSMKGEILPLFRDVLLVCEEMGLLGGTVFALDGCKLPSNASKEWSGTVSDLR